MCALLAALGIAQVRALFSDPSVNLLMSGGGGARWIRYPEAFLHAGRPKQQELSIFRTRFNVPGALYRAELAVEGFKRVVVILDKATIPIRPFDATGWKEPIELDLAPLLRPGAHELMLAVQNWNAHAAVRASCPVLGIHTDDRWEASHDGNAWTRARCLEEKEPLDFPVPLPTAAGAFAAELPWMLPLFAVVAAVSILRSNGRLRRWSLPPGRLRWMLIAVWVVVGLHNVLRIPLDQGFDASGHLDYIHFVRERMSLPLARDGWEMYQAPLYYMVSAGLDAALRIANAPHGDAWLRLIPLACGALQVEAARRIGRIVFEGREDLQSAMILVAGLLPVNLYVSQVVGNESFAGIATAVLILLCLRVVHGREPLSPRFVTGMGVVLGIALLSKVTAMLWVPLCGLALILGTIAEGGSVRVAAKKTASAWGIAVVIAGWFYARNAWRLGKPFVGNWDWKEANRVWWQDPSYRIPEHFTRFGRSLVQPIYAGIDGFWDGMYSTLWTDGFLGGSFALPPWRLESMIAGAWLGLPLTIAVLVAMTFGAVRASALRPAIRFSTLAVLLYVGAALYLYLRVPVYGFSKASYTLGLIPCYALLAVAGMKPSFDRAWSRSIACGFLACFGAAAIRAYFVVGNP